MKRVAESVGKVTVLALALAVAACASGTGSDDDGVGPDRDASATDGRTGGDASAIDALVIDARPIDARPIDATVDARPPIITGGPCLSGMPGATAYRIRWINGGGTAIVQYEVNGLPDHSRDHAGSYAGIGYTPQFVDIPLGGGGLLISSGNFVDIELTTVGLSSISNAQLSIYGRSYATGSSGSFDWQTFEDIGATPTNSVSNVAPYRWYSGDMTTAISAGNGGVLIRIKAGPSSGSLAVARIEICMQAT